MNYMKIQNNIVQYQYNVSIFKKIIYISICIFMFLLFVNPVSAAIINGDFETGDFTGWNIINSASLINLGGDYGSYTATLLYIGYPSSINQTFDSDGYAKLCYTLRSGSTGVDTYVTIWGDGAVIHSIKHEHVAVFTDYQYDISGYDSIQIKFLTYQSTAVGNMAVDNIYLTDLPITLMEFINEPIEVTEYAYLEVNLNDYWNTKADEHFYLSYDYYYKNVSNYTIIDFNELELNAQNTVNMIPTYYPYFNQTGGCEIKASLLYTYRDPVYHEVDLGYITTVLINSTYEPPEVPEEPEDPEIPDPEPEPEPEPDPPIPPIQPNGTSVNQSINVSWAGEYYNVVNDTFIGLCSPIYNFTNWSLSPVYSLNSSIGEYNYYMNESFTHAAQDSSILYDSINTIYGAIHPKIRNVITYYLIWVVLLIILKKD